MLADVFQAVKELLPETPSFLGPEELAANASPPRIVWLPSQDRFGGAAGRGSNPRALYTRFAGCEVHLWGEDTAATEQLLNDFIAVLHQVAHGSLELGQGFWVARNQAAWLQKGTAYVLPITLQVPIVRSARREATITQVVETCQVEG